MITEIDVGVGSLLNREFDGDAHAACLSMRIPAQCTLGTGLRAEQPARCTHKL